MGGTGSNVLMDSYITLIPGMNPQFGILAQLFLFVFCCIFLLPHELRTNKF